MKVRDLALLLLLGVIWGSAFLFIRVAVRDVPPMTLVAGRLILASGALLLLLRVTGRAFPPRAAWPVLLLLGVTNNVLPFTLISWSEERIASGLAATLNATMPLLTFVVALSLGQERLSVERAAGVAVGFAGALIIINPGLHDITSASKLGEVAVIAASASYAFSTVVARSRLRDGDPVGFAAGQLAAGALVAAPLALVVDRTPHLQASPDAALAWVALGLLCSALAYVIFFALVQRVSATQVALVSYVIPVVATVLGWAALGEHIGDGLIGGLALILIALAIVNGNARGLTAYVRGRRGASGAPTLRR